MNKKLISIGIIFIFFFTLASCNKASDSELAEFVKENRSEVEKVTKKIFDVPFYYPIKLQCFSKEHLPKEEDKFLREDAMINMDSLVSVCIYKIAGELFGTIYEFDTEEEAEIALNTFNSTVTESNYFRIGNWIYCDYVISYIILDDYIITDDYVLSKDETVCLRYRGESKEVVLPDSIEKIKQYAFNTTNVEKIICNENLKEIGDGCFCGNDNIREIVLNEGLEKICSFSFTGCVNLKEINLPLSLKYIGDYAFAGCESLEKIEIFESIEVIGDFAFMKCKNLTNLILDYNEDTEWGRYLVADSPNVKVTIMKEEPLVRPWRFDSFYIEQYYSICPIEYVGSKEE